MTTNPYEPAIRAVRRQIDALHAKLERLAAVEEELVQLAKMESRPTRPVVAPKAMHHGSSANGKRTEDPPAGTTWRAFVLQVLREASRPLSTRDIMHRTERLGHQVKRTTLYWALNEERKDGRAQKVAGGRWVASQPVLTLDPNEDDEGVDDE